METIEIVNTISTCLGISFDILLIFLILHTRKTITKINAIILNYAFSDVLGHIVLLARYSKQFPTQNETCTLNSLQILHQISTTLLLLILIFDCILALKQKDFCILLALIWSLSAFVGVLSCILCRVYKNSHPIDIVILTVYVTSGVCIIGKRIFNCLNNSSENGRVDVALVYMFLACLDVAEMVGYPKTVFGAMEWILQPLEFVFAAIFCAYLLYVDKHARDFCLTCYKCNLRKSESVANFANGDSDADKYSVDLSYSRANQDMFV